LIVTLSLLPGCALEKNRFHITPEQALVLENTPYFSQKRYQCGPASLAMLLGASDVVTHPNALVPHTYLPGRQGSLQLELVGACRKFNRIPYVIDPDISALSEELRAGRPVLVLQNLGLNILPAYHYAVVIGLLPPDSIVLRSGDKQRLVMDMEHFLVTWKRSGLWGMIVLKPGELPINPDPVRYLAAVSAFELSGNLLEATKGYQAAQTAWPENQTTLFALGNNYLSQGKYPEAEAVFRRLVENNPDHIAALNNLAEVFARQGCYSQASVSINRAVLAAERENSPYKKTVQQTSREIFQYLHQPGFAPSKICNEQL
jgi:hypothetical protein